MWSFWRLHVLVEGMDKHTWPSEANACTNVIAIQQEGERDQGRGKDPLFILWTIVKMSKELAKAGFHDNYLAFLDKLYTPSFWKVMVGCSWSVRGEYSWQNQTLGATWILMHAKLGGIMGFQRNNHLKRAMSRLNKEKKNLITTNISFIPPPPKYLTCRSRFSFFNELVDYCNFYDM